MSTAIEQLEAMRHLQENWDGYGAAVPRSNLLELAKEFAGLIEAVMKTSRAAPCLLHVSPTRSGGVLIEWEADDVEHEVELVPDGSISFLHLNKQTGGIETRQFSPGPLPPGLVQELRQLLAA